MKNSNYNSRHQFEVLIAQELKREVPRVNVRAAVRQALQGESISLDHEDVFEIIVSWFSGFRGVIATGVAVASVLALALVAYQQVGSIVESGSYAGSDGISDFIDSGDWSELL